MKIVQLSAGQGPSECCLAVAKAYRFMVSEAVTLGVKLEWLEGEGGAEKSTYRSILLAILDQTDHRSNSEGDFLLRWQGTMQWICVSPYRPFHRRKNWFFDAKVWDTPEQASIRETDFDLQTCRSGGAGGQHVNTTDSAVQITHRPTGLSVKVQTERSQHQNRRLAWALIQHKLAQQHESSQASVKGSLRMQHHQLERGRPIRAFEGEAFIERKS
jgi:peptide chain release factor